MDPKRKVTVGLATAVVGAVIIVALGGVDTVQGTSSPATFAIGALDRGNDVRWASFADLALFVPGLVLFSWGIVELIRGDGQGRVRRGVSRVGFASIVLLAVSDQTENTVLQLGLGTVDLDAPDAVLRPSEGLIDLFHLAHDVKWVAVFGLLLVAAAGVVLWMADRTGE